MRTLFILCCLLLFYSCGVQKKTIENTLEIASPSDTPDQLVKECFNGYKSAILNDEGKEAVEFADSRTIKYYDEILQKTIYADSAEVHNSNIMDKLMVLTIRHRTSKEDILSFDGKQLFVYAIQEGMIGKNSVANTDLGDIIVDNKFAKGQLVAGGTPAPMHFHFYKEQEEWKIDLTSIFPIANQAFQKMADDSGQDENEYLFLLLELITGETPTNEIWKPLQQK